MHRFHPSRGRILFETLCALTGSASLAGAWMQTGSSALLGGAGAAALYGLVHLFDMRQPKSVEAAEPQRIDFEPEALDVVVPMVAAVEPEPQPNAEEFTPVEAAPSRSGTGRRTGSRTGSGRRNKAAKVPKVVPVAAAEEAAAPWPMAEEPPLTEPATADDEEFPFAPEEDSSQAHIAPLFEPDPFVRMQRPAFGRRGRL